MNLYTILRCGWSEGNVNNIFVVRSVSLDRVVDERTCFYYFILEIQLIYMKINTKTKERRCYENLLSLA